MWAAFLISTWKSPFFVVGVVNKLKLFGVASGSECWQLKKFYKTSKIVSEAVTLLNQFNKRNWIQSYFTMQKLS